MIGLPSIRTTPVPLLLTVLVACGPQPSPSARSSASTTYLLEAPDKVVDVPHLAEISLPAIHPADPLDPNGEDDGSAAVGTGPALIALATAQRATFLPIAPPPGAHRLVCDLVPFANWLYASFANQPAHSGGARIYRFAPATGEWTLMLDWDRGGAPGRTSGVGGQGISRLRVIENHLYAPESGPPLPGGFGLSDAPFEDYIFVSNDGGAFPPLGADRKPPAGMRVVQRAFHVFDVIRYRGALVASGGTESQIQHGTRYPAGVFVGDLMSSLLLPLYRPGEGEPGGVIRTTYLHRFGGRLYMGFQDDEHRIGWDLAVLVGDPRLEATPPPIRARVTPDGGWLTRRFASTENVLYWIAAGYPDDGRGSALFASNDGRAFARIALPADAGAPQDLVILGDTRYLLTSTGLYRSGRDHRFARIADAPPGDPFGHWDTFCSAPLIAFADALYAGSTRDGTLYRITAE